MAKKPFPFSVCKECCEGGSGGAITIDTEMSDTSENAVQNKVITSKFKEVVYGMDDLGTSLSTDLYETENRINEKIDLKADKSAVVNITEPTYNFQFYGLNNHIVRMGNAESISFAFGDGEYPNIYMSSLSFDSGETPTAIDYTDSGILNWVGVDCVNNNGLSIFQPSANKHYDIVFYFNGTQFIGLVNGFVPATGNVVSE